MNNKPIIIVIAGRTAAGKTVLSNLLRDKEDFYEIVSATTREMRSGEVNGKDYHFLSVEDFEKSINDNLFMEHVNFGGNYYGILSTEVEKSFKMNRPAVAVTEPIGIKNVEKFCEKNDWNVVKVFVSCDDQLVLDRLSTRFNNDVKDLNKESDSYKNKEKSYLLRVENALGFEKENWVIPAYQTNMYDYVIKNFNDNNQDLIIDDLKKIIKKKQNKLEISKSFKV